MVDLEIPSRLELKYVVPEALVPHIARLIAPFCEPDRHSAASSDGQYTIWSLYLDSDDFVLHRASQAKSPRRFKARVRSYGNCGGPVFLEAKRKSGQIVRKTRAVARWEGWDARLRGALPADASPAERDLRALVERYQLGPKLLVRYRREAYFGRFGDYSRVTFDREIVCQSCLDWRLRAGAGEWVPLDDSEAMGSLGGVLMELKCTPDVPRWMEALVHRLELRRTGFSKCCTGIEKLWGFRRLECMETLQPVWG